MSYTASEAQQSRAPASRLEPAAVYKRMVITMRSLFSYARVLPAYRLYKACAVSLLLSCNLTCPPHLAPQQISLG